LRDSASAARRAPFTSERAIRHEDERFRDVIKCDVGEMGIRPELLDRCGIERIDRPVCEALPTTASAMRGRSRIERMKCSSARVDRTGTASVEVAGGSVCASSCGKTAVDALMPTVEVMVCSLEAMLRNGLDTSPEACIVPTGYITMT
jgi:hypothetical protein